MRELFIMTNTNEQIEILRKKLMKENDNVPVIFENEDFDDVFPDLDSDETGYIVAPIF